ncbi:MAG: energy transducer TonB [Bacteroidia bacterium]|nr:energy transducer TonB [Bacteroidia bacterium]
MLYAQDAEPGASGWPGLHEYLTVDEEPLLLHPERIRQLIGYPVQALKQQAEGVVYARVLVDAQGNYVRHVLTMQAHPLLDAAVERRLPETRFAPARKDGQALACWVNLMFRFSMSEGERRASIRLCLASGRQGPRRLPSYRRAERLYAAAAARQDSVLDGQVFRLLTRSMSHIRCRNERHRLLLRACYRERGLASAYLGEWDSALADLTDAISLREGVQPPEAADLDLYLDRSRVRLLAGRPLQALDDCNWVLAQEPEPALRHRALVLRALAALHLGHQDAAFDDLSAAADLNPGHGLTWYVRGMALAAAGAREAACSAWRQALDIGLDTPERRAAERMLYASLTLR